MKIYNLVLFISAFFTFSCAAEKKDLETKNDNAPAVELGLSSSQLDDFKVSYSDAEILDTGVKAEQPH
ncbi:MAG: hypothetical protein ACU83N_15885, partial [Gammaproteobacteria bacterium]